MNYKQIVGVSLICISMVSQIQAQSEATDKGSILVNGTTGFSSQGGDGFGDGDRLTTITLAPTMLYFISSGIGIGGELSFVNFSRGDDSITTLGLGPKIGYFIDSGTNLIPFVAGSVSYLSQKYDLGGFFGDGSSSGYAVKLGAGVIMRRGHLALSFEANYIHESLKDKGADDSDTGQTILLGVGLGGFLYK